MNKSVRKARLSEQLQATVNSALEASGVSAREVSHRVVGHDGLIRDIRRGNVPTADKIAGLADELELEFYFGPKRHSATEIGFSEAPIPIIGWARCGTRGDGPVERVDDRTAPAPIGFNHDVAFYAQAKGHSMRPEGIASGDYALIDPTRTAVIGDRVWVKDIKQMASLKRFIRQTDRGLHFRGWLDPAAGEQSSFDVEIPRTAVAEIYPVVAVFDGPPGGSQPPALRADPRAMEFGLATPAPATITAALGLEEDADEGQIIAEIEALKSAAQSMQKARELAKQLDDLNRRFNAL